MIKALYKSVGLLEEKRMQIAGISAFIALVAATISILIIINERRRKEEEEIPEDCFAE